MNGVGGIVMLGDVTGVVRLGLIVEIPGVVGDTVGAVVGTVGVERVVTVDVGLGGHAGSTTSVRA